MHDPCTQAFVIPWRYRWSTLGSKPWRYWEPLITIWHKDPERGGSDDSCGWSRPKLNEVQRDIVRTLAGDEARNPWFASLSAKENTNPVECENYIRGAILMVSRCFENRKCIRRPVTLEEATKWAVILTHNSVDNFRNSLCFLSGYHSNWYHGETPNTEKEDEYWREENARSFFNAIGAFILRERRFWFQHPKWHIHHWELQIHPLQAFKRWAFSRCCKCGGRFKWGALVGTDSWNSDGPSWRGEKQVYHMDCSRPMSDGCASEAKISQQ